MRKQRHPQMVQQYALDDGEAPSMGVYSAVAAVENRSPLDIAPLARAIDPDALDALLARERGAEQVSFEYCGYDVTATPDEIRVDESAE